MRMTAPKASNTGRRDTKPAQRTQKPEPWPSCPPWVLSRWRSRRLSTRRPMKPSIAGSNVSAVAMVSTTVMTTWKARPLRKLSRNTSSPRSAMHTVAPAKSTARPEVLSARTAASSGGRPAFRPSRCRVTMNKE